MSTRNRRNEFLEAIASHLIKKQTKQQEPVKVNKTELSKMIMTILEEGRERNES